MMRCGPQVCDFDPQAVCARLEHRGHVPLKRGFHRMPSTGWFFFGETCDDEGRPTKVWLYHAKSTPIKRHVKVKGEANPYDPTYETYFEEREGVGTRTL